MLIDSHVHTIHSADSDAPVATMIQRAIELIIPMIALIFVWMHLHTILIC